MLAKIPKISSSKWPAAGILGPDLVRSSNALNRFEGIDGERTMMALCIEGLMDVADSVAVTSAFPPALTTALLETLRRGDEKGLLGEQHYLDWVSAVSWSHFWQYLVALGHT